MYNQLKQILREHGYKPSEGEGWTGLDSKEFDTFIHFVLGGAQGLANRFLAYPTAFPDLLKRMAEVAGGASALTPEPEVQDEPTVEPEPEVEQPPVSETKEPDVFNLTPEGQTEKQELEQPPVDNAADDSDAPEGDEGDESKEQE